LEVNVCVRVEMYYVDVNDDIYARVDE